MDALGNWAGDENQSAISFFDMDGNGQYDPSAETLDVVPQQHNANARNQITSGTVAWEGTVHWPWTAPETPTTFAYDPAGNLKEFERNTGTGYHFIYDAWNRLVEVKRTQDNYAVAKYAYDALGRRINKKVGCTPGLNTDLQGGILLLRRQSHHRALHR